MSKHPQDVDVAFIEALAELLNRNGLSELSVKREYGEDDSLEVRVMRQLAPVAAAPVAAPPRMVSLNWSASARIWRSAGVRLASSAAVMVLQPLKATLTITTRAQTCRMNDTGRPCSCIRNRSS